MEPAQDPPDKANAANMMERLCRFLVGEVSAVAAYRFVLDRFPIEGETLLIPGLHGHEMLMEAVREWIENLGGTTGVIGVGTAFAGLDQVTIDKAGFIHSITLLRIGERQLSLESGMDLGVLDDYSRTFIARQVVPELARCLHALG